MIGPELERNRDSERAEYQKHTAVLYGTVDLAGNSFAENLLLLLEHSPNTKMLWAVGEPATGKSTFLSQLAWALYERNQERIGMTIVPFDIVLAHTEEQIAQEGGPPSRGSWEMQHWDRLSDNFKETVLEVESIEFEGREKTLHIVESVSIPSIDQKNRAVSAFHELVADEVRRRRTLVVNLQPHPELEKRTKTIRKLVNQLPDDWALSESLKSNFNIIIEEEKYTRRGETTLKNILRRMAKARNIADISAGVYRAAKIWKQDHSLRIKDMPVPYHASTLDVEHQVKLRLKTAYIRSILEDELRLDPAQFFIGFNIFTPEPIYWNPEFLESYSDQIKSEDE